MPKFSKDAIEKVAKALDEFAKPLESGKNSGVTYAFLPKGTHVVRPLPDSTPKLFAAARVHTMKTYRTVQRVDENGEEYEEDVEKTVTVLCGRGPDGQGYCPICEYASKVWEKEGRDSGVSWIFARPLGKFVFYVHGTDAQTKFRDEVQWGKGKIVVTAVSSKVMLSQILSLLRHVSTDPENLFRLINYTEEPFWQMHISYPNSRDVAPQVSWNPMGVIEPLDEDSLPEWIKADDFDMAKVGHIDFTKEPTVEELEEALEGYIRWREVKGGEASEAASKKALKEKLKKRTEEAEEGDTPPWDNGDDITRTPAKSADDPKPKCFGNYIASDECASCAYMTECIEALGDNVEGS